VAPLATAGGGGGTIEVIAVNQAIEVIVHPVVADLVHRAAAVWAGVCSVPSINDGIRIRITVCARIGVGVVRKAGIHGLDSSAIRRLK